jgi:class 3 adenylate cyclase/predicted ATPase
MPLGDWLRSLNLERYEAAFRENEIDEDILRDLTEEHLRELGLPLGARIKLLKAIAALPKPAVAEAAGGVALPGAPTSGERRQVTVMFSDLVGSTELSTRMDPEDLRNLISAYQNSVAQTVRRYGGFVAKYMGDGVLVYFGYPEAHEDDAEQAARAGLEVIDAVAGLEVPVRLQTRVGVATGLVIVGDLIGSGEAQERSIVGETPNLAARLQGIAAPNAVVVAESTRSLLGTLFDLQDLGPQHLKGIPGLSRAWAVLRTSSVASRFEALHATGLRALIGREEEFDLLLRRWSRAKAREGQVVLISGEAGIGKSRLTAALLEKLVGEPHTRLRAFCSPQRTDSALHPYIGQMERAAGFRHNDMPRAKLDKLDALLKQTSTSTEDAALFADMLSLPNDGRYPALDLTPQRRRKSTLEALVRQIQVIAHHRPVLMIVEDAHWIDPTSLEVLGLLVERIERLRVLLIVTFRPEFEPHWIGRPQVTAMTINRLGRGDIATLIDGVVGNVRLAASIRQDIIERTDGIPLFVEEMTKAVLEAESEAAARHTVAAAPSPGLAVPASLHASLMARLDRLGSAKEVAQIGATIGRVFTHALLAAVSRKAEAELIPALDRLAAAGLLSRQGAPPHATYLFKHALVQDAAYGTLLREPRRALHARIVEALEDQFPEIAENQPELLARHCTEAGLIEKAAGLWGHAGQRSLARSALVEAAEQLTRALEQIATLPAAPRLRRMEIELQVALINSLIHVRGFAAPETKAAVERARQLIEQAEALGEPPEDPLILFWVLFAAGTPSFVAFNGDAMREVAAQLLALAEKQKSTTSLMLAHRSAGLHALCTGNLTQGRSHFDDAIALYDPLEHRQLATHGQDARVATLSYRALILWLLGYPEAALADADEAQKQAREIHHPASLIYALTVTSFCHTLCGNYAAANAQIDEAVALAHEKGALFWKTTGLMLKGCSMGVAGNAADAAKMISSAIIAFRSTGATLWMPSYLSYLAKAHAELNQFGDAHRRIDEAEAIINKSKETWYAPEFHRVAGEIALMSPLPDAAKAERYFERALSNAREQKAKSWELRAATSLARLWRDQGKRKEAFDLLAPIHGSFTEGFGTRDLKEARALLDSLAL